MLIYVADVCYLFLFTGGEKGGGSPRRMDRLRRSFRDSFRKRKEHVPESSKPHQWQADEAAVRAGTCNFHVKVCFLSFTYSSFFFYKNVN